MRIGEAKALVTGGSRGIGLATAELLAARGARVAICGRDGKVVSEAAARFGGLGIVADVSDEAAVRAMVERVVAEFGDYDVLVNNAGFGSFAPLLETTAAQFRDVWETNVLGAMLVARESARHFAARRGGAGGGNIVNIASTAALRGFAGGSSYVASKFALSGLTECWRAELRSRNIRVMQVNPSEVQTGFGARAGRPGRSAANPSKLVAADVAQLIVSLLELEDRGFVTDATLWATNPQ
ncbi:MAG TPA: SDR family oxidoreductase [Gemmatimonadales bacterium]|nr:SDR family oxidoreductase [Gemmatimonadales bacterium]